MLIFLVSNLAACIHTTQCRVTPFHLLGPLENQDGRNRQSDRTITLPRRQNGVDGFSTSHPVVRAARLQFARTSRNIPSSPNSVTTTLQDMVSSSSTKNDNYVDTIKKGSRVQVVNFIQNNDYKIVQ